MISDCILLPPCWYNAQVRGAYLVAFALAQSFVAFSNQFCDFDEGCQCEATDAQLDQFYTSVLEKMADITRVLELKRAIYPLGNSEYYLLPPETP